MKEIGIVADNYKVNKFKKELEANGFKDYDIHPFTNQTQTIKVHVADDDFREAVKKIKKLCMRVELHFKHSN